MERNTTHHLAAIEKSIDAKKIEWRSRKTACGQSQQFNYPLLVLETTNPPARLEPNGGFRD
eukprot:scaffold3849_cov179-Amphora_coffeaeformis.AAC.26